MPPRPARIIWQLLRHSAIPGATTRDTTRSSWLQQPQQRTGRWVPPRQACTRTYSTNPGPFPEQLSWALVLEVHQEQEFHLSLQQEPAGD